MRTILLIGLGSIILLFSTSKAGQKNAAIKDIASLGNDTLDFQKQVEPIFQKNCMPCHFPGGKLYAKLPFDKAETILPLETGIRKRIKDNKEMELISRFIHQRLAQN